MENASNLKIQHSGFIVRNCKLCSFQYGYAAYCSCLQLCWNNRSMPQLIVDIDVEFSGLVCWQLSNFSEVHVEEKLVGGVVTLKIEH